MKRKREMTDNRQTSIQMEKKKVGESGEQFESMCVCVCVCVSECVCRCESGRRKRKRI